MEDFGNMIFCLFFLTIVLGQLIWDANSSRDRFDIRKYYDKPYCEEEIVGKDLIKNIGIKIKI